jgi:L-ascorbate metabolism protein UlaG (beta-lactamase superfamily)
MTRPASAQITYVGHSTVLVDMDGVKLLTDPVLRQRVVHLRRVVKLDMRVVRGVDAVLISHLHFDHLDVPSLERLGRELPVVVPRGGGAFLRRRGFRAVTEVEEGETLSIGAVSVRGTHAVHSDERRPLGAKADPLGFVFSGARSVYFAGDTELFDGMAGIGPVDVALLPIWGWGKTLGRGHMDPEDAVEAARRVQAAAVIPIHWGTYFPAQEGLRGSPGYVDEPVEDFATRMSAALPDTEVRVLRPGTATEV